MFNELLRLQEHEGREAVLKSRVEELEGMLGPVFSLVHDNSLRTCYRQVSVLTRSTWTVCFCLLCSHDLCPIVVQDVTDGMMKSGPEGYASLLTLCRSSVHNTMVLELIEREEAVKALTSRTKSMEDVCASSILLVRLVRALATRNCIGDQKLSAQNYCT